MATNESTAAAKPGAPQPMEHAFEPVAYGHPEVKHASLPGGAVDRFADQVEAVSIGSASILRLIEWDELRGDDHASDPETDPAPVLNNFHRGALLRMVAVNMDLIADQASEIRRWAYRQHTAEGKTEELAEAMRLVQLCERMAKGERA